VNDGVHGGVVRLLPRVLLLGLGMLGACGPTPDPETVIVVVLDSVSSATLSGAGGAAEVSSSLTPNLARFAEASTRFGKHIGASTGTNAALATLMTGLPPWSHGVGSIRRRGRGRLNADHVTQAELFREAGFGTLAAVALPQLRSDLSGLLQGFETILEPELDANSGWSSAELWSRCAAPLEERLKGRKNQYALVYLADRRASARAASVPGEAILVRRLNRFRDQDARIDGALRLAATDPSAALVELEACLGRGRGSAAHHALQQAKSDGKLAQMDGHFGELLELLERTGRADSATVWVVGAVPAADVSTGGGEVSRFTTERVLTPCMLRLVGDHAPSQVDGVVQSSTVGAVLLEAYGLSSATLPDPGLAVHGLCMNPDLSAGAAFAEGLCVELENDGHPRLFEWDGGSYVVGEESGGRQAPLIDDLVSALADRLVLASWQIEARLDPDEQLRVGWRFGQGGARAMQIGALPRDPTVRGRGSGSVTLDVEHSQLTLFGDGNDLPLRLRLDGPAFEDFDPTRYFLGATSFDRLPVLWLPCNRLAAGTSGAAELEFDAREPWAGLEHEGGGWWQLSVNARAGQAVRVLTAVFPPGEIDELLELDVPGKTGSIEGLPGRRDAYWVSGKAPLRLRVRKDPGRDLALHVTVGGRTVAPGRLRVGGRSYAVADEVEFYLPDWMPGITDALDGVAGLDRPERDPGDAQSGQVRIMRSAGPPAEGLAYDARQLEFVRRLGPNE